MATLFLDLETYSETPITHGTHRYAEAAEIMVVAWAIDDGEVYVEDRTKPVLDPILTAVARGFVPVDEIVIHNSHFDRTVLRHNGIDLPAEKITDTMTLALQHSLPGALGKLCEILRVPFDQAKDKDGKRLINLFCKPRPKKQKLRRATRETHPEDWQKFLDYARLDIEAMRAVYKKLPKWNDERELWQLDQKINDRGVAIDLDLVEAAIRHTDDEKVKLAAEAHQLTDGAVRAATQRDAVLRYLLEKHGIPMEDLRASTVKAMLDNDNYPWEVRELLRNRLKASTASVAKYKALVKGVSSDGRLRGTLQFCGASRTGRFCLAEGSPVLVKRETGFVCELPIEAVKLTDKVFDGVEWVAHEGVVFSGVKPVISYDSVVATREHTVYVSPNRSMPLQTAREAGLRIWGISDVLNLPPDLSDWAKLHRPNRKLREGALANALRARVEPEENKPSAVQRDPEARKGSVHRRDPRDRIDERASAAARDGTYRFAQTSVQYIARRGDRQRGRREGVLGAHEPRPEGQSRVHEEFERRHPGDLPSAGQHQSNDERRQVAGREPPRGVQASVSRVADCRSELCFETPGSAFHKVRPFMDTFQEGSPSPQEFWERRACQTGVGHQRSDHASREYIAGVEAPLAGDGYTAGETRKACCCESRSKAENPGLESSDVGEDESILGAKACRTYDIINAGPRNRFTVNGKIVSNSGRMFQPQNLPRPSRTAEAIEYGIAEMKRGEIEELVSGDVMSLASDAIRGCIVAPPGKKLVVADLSNIEGRVLAWLAGENWKLQAFRDYDAGIGDDLYKITAGKILGKRPGDVTKKERQEVGKVAELALGYQGGPGALLTFALAYGVDLDALAATARQTLPADIVEGSAGAWDWMKRTKKNTLGLERETWVGIDAIKRSWRLAHQATTALWTDVENYTRRAIEEPNTTHMLYGRVTIDKKGAWLRIRLPSGRFLCYPAPAIGEGGKISYSGVNQYSRKWGRISTYGGKLVENITQAVARDVLAHGMLEAEKAGYKITLTIHDEIISEAPDSSEFSAAGLAKLMSTNPSWADGLPLAAAGFEARRYRKGD